MGWAARANRARRLANGSEVRLVNPAAPYFASHIAENAKLCRDVVQPDSAKGKTLVLCGAGPSLAEHADECANGDAVWACNGALPWLVQNGYRVTHGFTVNQGPNLCALWAAAPDVEYLLASTVQPALTELLLAAKRRCTFFHNYVALQGQDALYSKHYPATICAGSGLNAVTRALDVASYMGFETITVLGADCCVRDGVMHVDGTAASESGCSDTMLSGPIDGRTWTAQADLWVSAVWLCRMTRASGGRIRLVGDTLPAFLLTQSEALLGRLPHMVNSRGERVPIPF